MKKYDMNLTVVVADAKKLIAYVNENFNDSEVLDADEEEDVWTAIRLLLDPGAIPEAGVEIHDGYVEPY